MRGKQIKMHHVREVPRLKAVGSSNREISGCVGIARSTVGDILDRAATVGLSWPLAPDLTDEALTSALYKRTALSGRLGVRQRIEPDWAALHLELRRPHVTLMLLWEEYRNQHPDGYGYSRFCELYRGFEDKLSPTMRQTHAAGDKMFVDFAGGTVPVLVDRRTGEIRDAQNQAAKSGRLTTTKTIGNRHHARRTFDPAELKSESVAELIGMRSEVKCGVLNPSFRTY